MRIYNKTLVENAQTLRKDMTPEERHIWYDFLKFLPLVVKRQYNIGNYILDFYIANNKIAIEIDGSQHLEPGNVKADEKRDEFLLENGITVLRYSNKEINSNFTNVCTDILNHLGMTFDDLKIGEA